MLTLSRVQAVGLAPKIIYVYDSLVTNGDSRRTDSAASRSSSTRMASLREVSKRQLVTHKGARSENVRGRQLGASAIHPIDHEAYAEFSHTRDVSPWRT
jgi:hypothetical protein